MSAPFMGPNCDQSYIERHRLIAEEAGCISLHLKRRCSIFLP